MFMVSFHNTKIKSTSIKLWNEYLIIKIKNIYNYIQNRNQSMSIITNTVKFLLNTIKKNQIIFI